MPSDASFRIIRFASNNLRFNTNLSTVSHYPNETEGAEREREKEFVSVAVSISISIAEMK